MPKKPLVEAVQVPREHMEMARSRVRPVVANHIERRANTVPNADMTGFTPPDEMELAATCYLQALRDIAQLFDERKPEALDALLATRTA